MKSTPTYSEVRTALRRLEDSITVGTEASNDIATIRQYLDTGHVQMTKCRERLDDSMYDVVADTAIGVITKMFYLPTDIDTAGAPIEDAVQSCLMESMLRAPLLINFLRDALGEERI